MNDLTKYAKQQGTLHANQVGNTPFATMEYQNFIALSGMNPTPTRQRRFVAAFQAAAAKAQDARLAAWEQLERDKAMGKP